MKTLDLDEPRRLMTLHGWCSLCATGCLSVRVWVLQPTLCATKRLWVPLAARCQCEREDGPNSPSPPTHVVGYYVRRRMSRNFARGFLESDDLKECGSGECGPLVRRAPECSPSVQESRSSHWLCSARHWVQRGRSSCRATEFRRRPTWACGTTGPIGLMPYENRVNKEKLLQTVARAGATLLLGQNPGCPAWRVEEREGKFSAHRVKTHSAG